MGWKKRTDRVFVSFYQEQTEVQTERARSAARAAWKGSAPYKFPRGEAWERMASNAVLEAERALRAVRGSASPRCARRHMLAAQRAANAAQHAARCIWAEIARRVEGDGGAERLGCTEYLPSNCDTHTMYHRVRYMVYQRRALRLSNGRIGKNHVRYR